MSMEPADAFEHAGLAVRICWQDYIDENDNPRTNQDGNLGVMFCEYPRYSLGDEDAPDPRGQTRTCEQCKGSGEDLFEVLARAGYGSTRVRGSFKSAEEAEQHIEEHAPEGSHWYVEPQDCEKCEGSGEVEVGIIEYLKREHGARVILPLFVYEHSGITMSCGGRLDKGEDDFNRHGRYPMDSGAWDTSSVGVIFDTEESRKECGLGADRSDEEIEASLRSEVAYYAAYLENNVFGFQIIEPELDEDGEFDPKDCEGEELDSCWGFLELSLWGKAGEEAYVKVAAREAAEACREEIERERAEAHHWACADVVTVP